uniref:Uncharacterized protein n=1 Tax=Arundo donax TaxID=35708 RepID=A0A0A9AZA9_ARUDO
MCVLPFFLPQFYAQIHQPFGTYNIIIPASTRFLCTIRTLIFLMD